MEYRRVRPELALDAPPKLLERLTDAKRQFDKAVDQIRVLDLQMKDLQTRYRRAVKTRKNSFRYSLRLKLSVVTGIRMMYDHFATKKSEEVRLYSEWLALQAYDPTEAGSQQADVRESPSRQREEEEDEPASSSSPSSSVFSQSTDDYSSSGEI